MSLTTNKTKIQQLLDGINNLPEAGSDSGSGVETCTVIIRGNEEIACFYGTYYTLVNGEKALVEISSSGDVSYEQADEIRTLSDVLIGTDMVLYDALTLTGMTISNSILIGNIELDPVMTDRFCVFHIKGDGGIAYPGYSG